MKNAISGATYYDRCLSVYRNLQEYQQDPASLLVAIGRREPWPDENNPPLLHPISDQVIDPIVFVQVHQCTAAYEDKKGTIRFSAEDAFQKNFRGGARPASGSVIRFSELLNPSIDEMVAAKATQLVVTASLPRSALAGLVQSYRIVAICSDVQYTGTPPAEVVSGGYLLPAQVSSYNVRWLSTTSPVLTEDYSIHSFRVIRRY